MKETTNQVELFTITEASFEELYLRYWERLYAFCLKTVEDEEGAKEIVQEVFKSLWERRAKLRLQEVERYLIRAVKLRAYEHIRNKVIRSQHHRIIRTRTESQVVEDYIGTQELHSRIVRLINTLPTQCKKVFQLSRDQGMTNKEIASKLVISERAVEYHISRALRALKTHLSDYLS